MNAYRRCAVVVLVLSLLVACTARAAVTEEDFGKTADGVAVRAFTLTNKNGGEVRVMTYGACLMSLKMPDRDGKLDDVVLGYDQLEDYLTVSRFFGMVVGRYANRIGGAHFVLNGVEYKLAPNDRGNTLHGGRRGFDKVVWTGSKIDDQTVELVYLSKDGEEGFPGNLTARVRYTLTDANELKLDYSATTDKDTVVNLSNHSFFNLAGQGKGDVLGHELMIDADSMTASDPRLIPTGQLVPVADTPFDFRQPHKIGERIKADDERIRSTRGYDQNFVLNKKDGLRLAASVYEPSSGRVMEVLTTQPAVQLYTGNGLDGRVKGKGGNAYPQYGGMCLETQHYPDSPNHPEFPTTTLKAGETFQSTTVYKFSTK
jgi:aldose 1-epimerase